MFDETKQPNDYEGHCPHFERAMDNLVSAVGPAPLVNPVEVMTKMVTYSLCGYLAYVQACLQAADTAVRMNPWLRH